MAFRLQILFLALLAAVAIGLTLGDEGKPATASDAITFDCTALGGIIPVAICEFDNVTASNANDIHVVFNGFVINIIDNPPSSCRASRQFGRASVITTYNCRFLGRGGGIVPPGGTYTMLVLYAGDTAHVSSWHWTLNGTPFPNTTPTNTPTPASFPTPTPTPASFPTPTPTAASFPTPTPTPASFPTPTPTPAELVIPTATLDPTD